MPPLIGYGILIGANAPASTVGPLDPLSIVTSVARNFFLIGDLGTNIVSGVSLWQDQSGAGQDASQATPGSQPALQTAALGGRNTVLFDGIDDSVAFATLNLPVPGTTPTWYWIVFRQVTWAGGNSIFAGGSTTRHRLFTAGVSPTLEARNSGGAPPANNGAPIGTFVRGEFLLSNDAIADYLKLGATMTAVSTGNLSVTAPTFTLGGTGTGGGCAKVEVACFGSWAGKPTAGELAALDAWVTAYYGASVLV